MAGSIGFKEAMAKAEPILLEPVSELVVLAPEAQPGRHHGRPQLQARAHPGVERRPATARSRSWRSVPTSEVLRYAIDLRSMTGGRGRFTATHSHYDPVPAHLVDKVRAATAE